MALISRVDATDGDILFAPIQGVSCRTRLAGPGVKLGHDFDLLTREWAPLWVVISCLRRPATVRLSVTPSLYGPNG